MEVYNCSVRVFVGVSLLHRRVGPSLSRSRIGKYPQLVICQAIRGYDWLDKMSFEI